MVPIRGPPQATHTRLTRRALNHPHKDSAAAHFGQTQAPAAAAAPAQEPPRNGHHDWHEAGNRSGRHDAHNAEPDPPTQHARGEAEGTEEGDVERADHDAEPNLQGSATKRPLPPGDTPPRRQAPDERPSPGSAEAQASRALRTQEPTAEGKQRTVQGDQAAVDAPTAELRARSGANTSLSPPGPRETDLATRTATQREAVTVGGAATTPTVGATAEEAAPAVAEVGGSAVEDKAGKTRAELAANAPIGPGAGKAAAVAGAAAAATPARGGSAAPAPIAGAQHTAPAAHASAVTRPSLV